MIKSFSLFTEAQQRIYKKSNNFSEGHRYPNLPYSCTMYDIDNLLLSSNDKVMAIIEDKYRYNSETLGNPFIKGSPQRKLFHSLCKSIDLVLVLLETSTKRIYKVLDYKSIKIDYDVVFNYGKTLKTDNILYVEFRRGKPEAIMYRTNDIKETELYLIDTFKAAQQLSQRLNIPLFLVNDVLSQDIIYIKKFNDTQIYELNYKSADSWMKVYKEIGLYK
jgi:hypothetical protein